MGLSWASSEVGLVMGLMGLLSGLAKSADPPSRARRALLHPGGLDKQNKAWGIQGSLFQTYQSQYILLYSI